LKLRARNGSAKTNRCRLAGSDHGGLGGLDLWRLADEFEGPGRIGRHQFSLVEIFECERAAFPLSNGPYG
jgi:hypothetical protein